MLSAGVVWGKGERETEREEDEGEKEGGGGKREGRKGGGEWEGQKRDIKEGQSKKAYFSSSIHFRGRVTDNWCWSEVT